MDKILDFLHISLGSDRQKQEKEINRMAGSEVLPEQAVQKVDKALQFPEPLEPLAAGESPQAGVWQATEKPTVLTESDQSQETCKPGKNVAVKNLPRQLKKGELESLLSRGPKPKNITFVRNNGKFHGMVLIKYSSAQDATLAVNTLNGTPVRGKPVIVEFKKKTKKDKTKKEQDNSDTTPLVKEGTSEEKSDEEEEEEQEEPKFTKVPFRRHSIAFPHSALRRTDFDTAMFRRNSVACFTGEDDSLFKHLPPYAPVRQPKGPESQKGFSSQYRTSRRVSFCT